MKSSRRRAGAALLPAAIWSGAVAACGNQAYLGGPSVTTVASARSATVDVRDVPGFGRVLVTGTGTTLYLLTSDPTGGSDCTGPCSLTWPPFVVSGRRLKAGPGVNPSLLSSFTRSGGGRQVTYGKHALYTFEQDAGPGMATGQGFQSYGGTWWVVAADGQPVTK